MRNICLRILNWLLVGLALLPCWGQNPNPSPTNRSSQSGISKLAAEKAEINSFDLVLLTARIRLLEQALAHPQHRNEAVVGMAYDKSSGRGIIKSWVDPTWTAAANLETAKKELTEQATSYCVY